MYGRKDWLPIEAQLFVGHTVLDTTIDFTPDSKSGLMAGLLPAGAVLGNTKRLDLYDDGLCVLLKGNIVWLHH